MNLKRWEFSDSELAALVAALRLEPGPLSPLAELPPWTGPVAALPPDDELRLAVTAAARPISELGLLQSPPFGRNLVWFFRGESTPPGTMVSHHLTGEGRHVLLKTDRDTVTQSLRVGLDLETPTPDGDVNLILSAAGFQALIGVIDFNREWGLDSLLQRAPESDRVFTPEDAVGALARSSRSEDYRWLGAVAALVTPGRLTIDEATATRGIEELRLLGLVVTDGSGYKATDVAQPIFVGLGSPVAYCGLRAGMLAEGAQVDQRAVIRGLNSLWMLEYKSPGQPNASVCLRATDHTGVDLRIREFVDAASRTSVPSTAPLIPAFGAGRPCPRCGRITASDARFCPGCGLDTQAARACVRCGAPATDPTAAFCAGCGAPSGETDASGRPSFPPLPSVAPPLPSPDFSLPPLPMDAARPPDPGFSPPPLPPLVPSPGGGPGWSNQQHAGGPPEIPAAVPFGQGGFPVEASTAPGHCPNPACGKPLRAGKKFCTSCGAKV